MKDRLEGETQKLTPPHTTAAKQHEHTNTSTRSQNKSAAVAERLAFGCTITATAVTGHQACAPGHISRQCTTRPERTCRLAHRLAALMNSDVNVPNKRRTISSSIASIAILRILNAGGPRGIITFQCVPETRRGHSERRRW